jgi:hypothetical protein
MDGTGEHHEVSHVQKDKGPMFSLMWKTDPIQIQNIIIYTYKHIENMFPKVVLLEEGRKE